MSRKWRQYRFATNRRLNHVMVLKHLVFVFASRWRSHQNRFPKGGKEVSYSEKILLDSFDSTFLNFSLTFKPKTQTIVFRQGGETSSYVRLTGFLTSVTNFFTYFFLFFFIFLLYFLFNGLFFPLSSITLFSFLSDSKSLLRKVIFFFFFLKRGKQQEIKNVVGILCHTDLFSECFIVR